MSDLIPLVDYIETTPLNGDWYVVLWCGECNGWRVPDEEPVLGLVHQREAELDSWVPLVQDDMGIAPSYNPRYAGLTRSLPLAHQRGERLRGFGEEKPCSCAAQEMPA